MANPSTGQTIMDSVAYLSSVSGGSWAAVIYTFLPSGITDAQFLVTPQNAANLYKGQSSDENSANVCYMGPSCLGTVPQQFNTQNIAQYLYTLYEWGFFGNSSRWSWFWIAAVGEMVLKPFGLYDATYDPNVNYIQPSNFFSLSSSYVSSNIQNLNPTLSPQDFYVCAPGRPTLIVNTNLLENYQSPESAQVPVQAQATSTSVPGQSPDGTLIGGGGVESFAFTSTLTGAGTNTGTANVTFDRRYSLCDIAGCSSAFFAAFLLEYLNQELDDVVQEIEQYLVNEEGWTQLEAEVFGDILEAVAESFLDAESSNVIPLYNYWPLNQVDQSSPVNNVYGFSDGGDFDNTGIIGMLAQSNVNCIIAFVNTDIPISAPSSQQPLDPSIPLLFGQGTVNNQSLQIFSNDNNELSDVINGLYTASCSSGSVGTATAAYLQTLTTVANPVANIQAGRQVQILWIYNNRADNWQSQITDAQIQQDLQLGQSGSSNASQSPLWNFPSYNTFKQFNLVPEAVNMLAQFSAWNVQQVQTEIYEMLGISVAKEAKAASGTV
jgi:hypothetical protein